MIGTVIEIFATLVDVLFLIWFIPKFNEASIKNKPISLVWAGLLLAFQLVADRFLKAFDLLYAFIDFLIAVCFSFSLSRKKGLWNVLSGAIYVTVIMLSSTLVFTIFSLFTENFADFVKGDISFVRLTYLLVAKMIHLTFYKVILLIFKKDHRLDVRNNLFSILFTVITAVELGILLELSALFYQGEMGAWITALSILMIVQNIILYLMIGQIQKLLKNKYELYLIREKTQFEKSRIEEATNIWNNVKKLRHDLKNHFAVLRGKLDENDTESCKQYLSKLDNTVDSMGDFIKSGNSVIDYLINSKLSRLENVQVLVSGYVGNYKDIEEIDLACILGNVLDNAIEAQEHVVGEKRIELHFLQKNSNRVIICKNTINESVLQKNKELKSTKDFGDLHGLGHQIVESTVQKYNGLVNYYEDDGMFGVQIVIPI